MRLIHFSRTGALNFSRSPIQQIPSYRGEWTEHDKPTGFWVSDEDAETSWSEWCASENYADLSKQPAYEVVLIENHNVLMIESVEALDAFAERFGALSDPYGFGRDRYIIQWDRVAKEYDGIIITPYQWSRRLHHESMWYYGWDCASGCIWNFNAVDRVEQTNAQLYAKAIGI